MTFFSKVEHSFQVISEGEDIATESFLQAAREILPFLGTSGLCVCVCTCVYSYVCHNVYVLRMGTQLNSVHVCVCHCLYDIDFVFADTLGKVAFSPVKSDINGNITVSDHEVCLWF